MFFRLLVRSALGVLRALFIVVLIVIPVPIGAFLIRLVDRSRRQPQVTQVHAQSADASRANVLPSPRGPEASTGPRAEEEA